ncbi:MAG TPA: 16S rRNA (guanine(966)-N(2))-methyltransferase RsmD [Actinophytocola sp.]|uniref:16S rRNA (guanine(966)-N(2))-methyltransferase RsmD n=1 Tax=Actinophytocola sp. TaxID=1872138 RepID=UPI002DBF7277|nr:16S rRNA (guanine(966)-N(2))-methyltransferase RsmD [Actinophytocola sp.]HEU5469023.1 16S rRNA (guanine(966)-N(2))-methyltransferase RsmD [Actinophytocola sp.]
MTRIVAGTAGGRRLAVPPRGTRPTSERVREALFSAVQAAMELPGARVLDLYAGSGALGFEALSRGAATATFVESDRSALAVLERNVAAVGLPGAEVRRGKVRAVLAGPAPAPYHLVLADPPYDLAGPELAAVLGALVAGGWTGPDTLVVVERARRSGPPDWPEPLRPTKVRRYGDTELHWATHGEPEG